MALCKNLQAFGFLLILCLLGDSAIEAYGNEEISIRWHGQSFFEITSPKGTRIVLDPHQIESYGRKQVEADLVLVSHLHSDHMQLTAVTNKDKAKIINGLKVDSETKRQEWDLRQEVYRDISVEVLGAYHDGQQGLRRGKTGMFLIQIGKIKILHCGDLGHALDVQTLRKVQGVDFLLLPIGGVYTINGEEARQIMNSIKPRVATIPMHYGTKVYDGLLGPEEFLDEVPKASVKNLTSNQFKWNTAENVKEPMVLFLNHE